MDLSDLLIIILLILILVVIVVFIILTILKKTSSKNSNSGTYASYSNNNDTNVISTRYMRNAEIPSDMRINIRTRNGENPPEFKTIGTLYHSDTSMILKLVGKEVYRGSNNWNYYALSSDYSPNRLTVLVNSKNCAKEYGCPELYDNNIVQILEYAGRDFTVQLYPRETLRYIPSI
jgi:hypothetical protein